jgi:hypothetical protein
MFFIFGFGKQTVREYGKTAARQCSRCEKMTTLVFIKVTTWITFFFIPVIPYRMQFLLVCPVCNASTEVPKEEVDNIINALLPLELDEALYPSRYELPGEESDDWINGGEQQERLTRVGKDPNRFAGKNPTQRAFIEKMEAHEEAMEAEARQSGEEGLDIGKPSMDTAPAETEVSEGRERSLAAWEKELEARERALEAREKALTAREAKDSDKG